VSRNRLVLVFAVILVSDVFGVFGVYDLTFDHSHKGGVSFWGRYVLVVIATASALFATFSVAKILWARFRDPL
jgi:formate hydrogenlyase subunit 3/multisubunit Na+/H+ antiporter MnhD subunit